MSTGLVLVHGRSQQLPSQLRHDSTAVVDHVRGSTRTWMAGLARGLVLAGKPPVLEDLAVYPFYGDVLAEMVEADQAAGGHAPDLEFAGGGAVRRLHDELVVEAARTVGFDPRDELHVGTQVAGRAREPGADELALGDLLGVVGVHAALEFVARKTGVAGWLIEQFLADVAYYLGLPGARKAVQDIVMKGVDQARSEHDAVVLVSHSLGTVVAYDVLARLDLARPVTLLVTLGSPLGLPVVRRKLAGGGGVPDVDAAADPRWINAFDVRDAVALVHPLEPEFRAGVAVRDIVVHNPSDPHSVQDYLSDRDVAAAIAAAL